MRAAVRLLPRQFLSTPCKAVTHNAGANRLGVPAYAAVTRPYLFACHCDLFIQMGLPLRTQCQPMPIISVYCQNAHVAHVLVSDDVFAIAIIKTPQNAKETAQAAGIAFIIKPVRNHFNS